MKDDYAIEELKEAGYTLAELREAGYSEKEVKRVEHLEQQHTATQVAENAAGTRWVANLGLIGFRFEFRMSSGFLSIFHLFPSSLPPPHLPSLCLHFLHTYIQKIH
jgi:hypothetical protein